MEKKNWVKQEDKNSIAIPMWFVHSVSSPSIWMISVRCSHSSISFFLLFYYCLHFSVCVHVRMIKWKQFKWLSVRAWLHLKNIAHWVLLSILHSERARERSRLKINWWKNGKGIYLIYCSICEIHGISFACLFVCSSLSMLLRMLVVRVYVWICGALISLAVEYNNFSRNVRDEENVEFLG